MRKELEYFWVGGGYGWCQDWFFDPMMKLGGCAAVVACDSSVYFDRYRGTGNLYPYEERLVTKEDYLAFSRMMKPYLRPRWTGVDTLELYMEGYGRYLEDRGCRSVHMRPFYGIRPAAEAIRAVRGQIDGGFPVPCLTLNHADPAFHDYEWHWYLLTGYEERGGRFRVKTVTYGEWEWLDLEKLWNTGRPRKGGLVLYSQETGAGAGRTEPPGEALRYPVRERREENGTGKI